MTPNMKLDGMHFGTWRKDIKRKSVHVPVGSETLNVNKDDILDHHNGWSMSKDQFDGGSVAKHSKSLSLLPTQQPSFTLYLSHNLINQGNVKVMSEHDTIKYLFDQLMNMIKLPTCNLSLMKTDYNDWLDSAEATGSNHSLYAYLEDENGNVPKSKTLGKIHRALCAGWQELGQHGMALDTWGKASTSMLQFICLQMEKEFPLFKLADNGWKLEYICTKMYSAWRKHHLDDGRGTQQ
ncbi:hypothetical protein EDD16DRAFT_1520668 [Pisolithus croceorrhizus]|nr:hypothetical protein EDD16DRAFT_1520668 [Pisolithus croceorrhizus]